VEPAELGRPWTALVPGDVFEVRSHSRQLYSLTLLVAGPKASVLYVRSGNGGLSHLDPRRVDWSTLRKLGTTCPVVVGDRILVVGAVVVGNEVLATSKSVEYYGELFDPITDRIALTVLPDMKRVTIPLQACDPASFRVAFRATRITEGTEFAVDSKSGNPYYARAITVGPTEIQVALVRTGKVATLRLDFVALETLRILLPVPLASVTAFAGKG
jgi:hypothetical protein